MIRKLKNEKLIWGILIVLLWLLELGEEFDLTLWERVIRSTLITITLIIAFKSSKYFYAKINNAQAKTYNIWFVFIILSILSFGFNSLFIDPFEVNTTGSKTDYFTILFFDMFLIFHILIVFIISWAFHIFKKNKENELALSQLIALNKESELLELKKQLNPHFLFNALSNIYSIAYLGDKETPEKILQLSKMLRYVIYETDVKYIELSKEIEYLEYFIDFQRFKIKKEQQIEFDFKEVNLELKIAPLLLLPFIENAFKHSQIDVESNAWVKITLKTIDDCISFDVENTISKKAQPEILNNKGIGLENIKKRIELVYGSEAELQIIQNKTFKVKLIINIK
jgi:sensor histidine kinase YesM